MINQASLFAPVHHSHEAPRKLFMVLAALLAVLPLVLYVATHYFDVPIFDSVWVTGIVPGWPLALFLVILGLPNKSD